ncbi:MAG TPA: hypothetical protein DCL48_02705, partial [Alphaproteobacteria bacterium]|nr:hypothetical protein [Alphaproteobacteria bacterium]
YGGLALVGLVLRPTPVAEGLGFLVLALASVVTHARLQQAMIGMPLHRSASSGATAPLAGSLRIGFTLAGSLVPLALALPLLNLQFTVLVSVLYRRVAVDQGWYLGALTGSLSTIGSREIVLAAVAITAAAGLAVSWGVRRQFSLRHEAQTQHLAAALSPAQTAFVSQGVAAAEQVLSEVASASRHRLWTFAWIALAAPALLIGAWFAYSRYNLWREAFAMRYAGPSSEDFSAFAAIEPGFGHLILAAALVLAALFLRNGVARLIWPSARYDQFAFEGDTALRLRLGLLKAVAKGEAGPTVGFDPVDFLMAVAGRRHWLSWIVTAIAGLSVVASVIVDFGSFAVFTGQGVYVSQGIAAPAKLVPYEEVEAAAAGCVANSSGLRPTYQLTLPQGRVIEMIGPSPFDGRLDQYLSVDRRLQYAGTGFAYVPTDGRSCLAAIEAAYNPVIAAGAGRLLRFYN